MQVGLIHDVVAVEDRPRAVSTDLHRDSVLYARALHVADGGPPQIVKEQARKSRAPACFRPAIQMIVDGAVLRAMENPTRTRRTGFPLALQPAPHVAIDRQRPGLLPFRLADR